MQQYQLRVCLYIIMQEYKSEPLSRKSRGLLYHFKKSLHNRSLLLDTHICNLFEYRKEKFNKKEFHKLIRKYDEKVMLGEIDQLFEELDESKNGFVFYEFLLSAFDCITEEDNPTMQLNRRSKIMESPSKKKTFDVLIELKDLLLSTSEDYLSVIEIFITQKDGYITKENIKELMNNFDFREEQKQNILLSVLFGTKHKIEIVDFLEALNLTHNATRINLSEMSLEESMIMNQEDKSEFIRLQEMENKNRYKGNGVIEESRILDSLNEVMQSGVYSIDKIPSALAEYFNYGSELEEEFALIVQDFLKNKQIFIDTENPTTAKAAGWIHINEINKSYALFQVAKSIVRRDSSRKGLGAMLEPNDIIQGGFGDCYFLSAIAAIVQDYPQLVYRLFVLEKNPSHIFGVRLFIDGIWKTILLDGCFPVNHYGALCGAQPHHNEIWVMLLEKAWAKVYKSFENIYSGYNEEGLLAVSGAPTISLSSRKENFLKRVQVEFGKGSIVTCATSKDVNQLTQAEQESLGVFAAHAYTILKIYSNLAYKNGSITLIKIRNPWGKKGWKGDWSFSSPLWTNELREQCNYKVNPSDGTFFICEADFIMYFDHINISKVNLGYRNSHITNTGNRYWFYQNRVQVKTKGDYFFTLYQENPRKFKNSSGVYQKSKSWIFLAKVESFGESGEIVSMKSIASSATEHKDNTIETTLQPGVYVILSSVSWNYWEDHIYTITSYGPEKVKFSPAEKASESTLGKFITSFSNEVITLGGASFNVYEGTNISKNYFFNHSQGFGFITITNQDKRMIEVNIRLAPCTGITILAPYSLPLSLTVLPFESITASFLVDPHGYNYRMHESYKLFAIG